MVAESSPGVQLTTLQILLGLFIFAAGGFAAWLYRHEAWFRNIVFPLVQVLTGESPRGDDLPADGHIEQAENRLETLESRIENVQEDVEDLARTQKRHNRQTEGWLRRIFSHLDGVEPDELDDDEPLFRGGQGNSSGRSSGGSDD